MGNSQPNILYESKLLAKHTLIYGAGTAINSLVGFLLLPIYTRYLSPNDYGVKVLVAITTDVIGILLATAISSAVYRFYFEYEQEKDRNEVISSAMIVVGITGLIAVSLLYLVTKPMGKYILDSADLYYLFAISFTSMWFQSLNNIGYNYLRVRQKSFVFVLLSFCRLLLALGLNIYFIVFLGLGVLGVLISTLISSIIVTVVLVVPIIIRIGMRFSSKKTIDMIKFGLPLIPSQLGAFVVHLSDRFFIKEYASIADAGLYSLGHKFGTIPGDFISGPFNQIWQPRRLELYKEEGSEELFGKIFTYFLFIMIFAGLAVSVLARDVLMIVADDKFWAAYKIVPIIVVASTIFSMHYHLNMGILITKKTKYFAYINFSNAFVVLALNFILIPRFGVFGAAYAAVAAFIYKVSLTYYFSSRYYKIYFEFVRILKILIAAILVYLGSIFLVMESVYMNLALKAGLMLLFPSILFLLRFFSTEEKRRLGALARGNFREMVGIRA